MNYKNLIVKASKADASYSDEELQKLLDDGWKVTQMCPMPSAQGGQSGKAYMPTCLVILEKF